VHRTSKDGGRTEVGAVEFRQAWRLRNAAVVKSSGARTGTLWCGAIRVYAGGRREFRRGRSRLGAPHPRRAGCSCCHFGCHFACGRGYIRPATPENRRPGRPVSLLAASRYNPWASRSVVQIHSPRLSSHNDLGLRWSACCHRSGANPFAATRSYKDLANPVLGLRCHCRCHFSRRAPGFTPRLSSPTSVCTGSGAGCGNFNRRCTAITVHPHRYGGQTSGPAA